jgi:hypothetical protein
MIHLQKKKEELVINPLIEALNPPVEAPVPVVVDSTHLPKLSQSEKTLLGKKLDLEDDLKNVKKTLFEARDELLNMGDKVCSHVVEKVSHKMNQEQKPLALKTTTFLGVLLAFILTGVAGYGLISNFIEENQQTAIEGYIYNSANFLSNHFTDNDRIELVKTLEIKPPFGKIDINYKSVDDAKITLSNINHPACEAIRDYIIGGDVVNFETLHFRENGEDMVCHDNNVISYQSRKN